MADHPNGSIFRTNDGYAIPVQPDGAGGLVTDPTQQPEGGAFSARFLPGCGHSVTRYDVKQEYSEDLGRIVLRCCCPTCGFVARTIEVGEYLDNNRTPILA